MRSMGYSSGVVHQTNNVILLHQTLIYDFFVWSSFLFPTSYVLCTGLIVVIAVSSYSSTRVARELLGVLRVISTLASYCTLAS